VGGVLSGLLQTLGGIIDFVTGVFSGNWSQAWQGIVDIFGGIFKGLGALVTAPINAMINLVNQAIRAVNNISVDIPDWLGGGTLGFNIPEIPNIGGYADGGIVSSPELAWVGEGGDKEVVIPINNSNRSKNLHETAGRMLGVTKDSGGSGDINITVSNTINLSGSATEEDAKRVAKAVNDDLERRLRKIEERRRRVSFA
ncbi:hypothetical protein M5W70_21745, partial [Paenibacillus larvae]|nr:hypothetical protein [Paenibacillus larvae]